MKENMVPLLVRARRALDLPSQGALGEALGSSARSGQRWERNESKPSADQVHQLVRRVHPVDAALAAELAEASDTTLLALGLEAPPAPAVVTTAAPEAPAPPPPPPPPDPIHIVDTVVCAAAEAMQLMPEAIRPALRAAFRRARLAGLSVEDVDRALHPRAKTQTP
jgi:hypothetical protein